MKTLLAAAFAIGAAGLGSSAPATVITFDGPGYGPAYAISTATYQAAGYTFTTGHQEAVWIPVNQGADNGTQIFVTGFVSIDNLIFGIVPEPETWLLMIGGFGLVGVAARRRAGVVAV